MPRVFIDNQEVEVKEGTTILEAARMAGIEIPTLCFLKGYAAPTSCMVCVVKVNGGQRLVPSCATRVADGMHVESETEEVRAARRTALELLLGDHLGDCIGPCQSACPAHMDIPAMIRHIGAGRLRDAIVTVKEHIALPAVLGRICPQICEKACRRTQADGAVSICELKRVAADADLTSGKPYLPARNPASGKQVAIVGAGPAGLAAAYYLLQQGHACTIFDDHKQPGGMLREGVGEDKLPRPVLDAEIGVIERLGAKFRLGVRVGADLALAALRKEFDAVLLATGEMAADAAAKLGVPMAGKGLKADRQTMQTATAGVFVAGSALSPSRHAVRAVADGRSAAAAIGRFLAGEPLSRAEREFTVHIGRMEGAELAEFMATASRAARAADASGLTPEESVREAARCLHCDCRKLATCTLRAYADQYDATPSKFRGERRRFEQDLSHDLVIYEPGKCIACGRCELITQAAGEELGLTFVGRGFTVRTAVPFNDGLAAGLRETAEACVAACPTAALSMKDEATNVGISNKEADQRAQTTAASR